MTKQLTSSDIYDVNKKTGALILGKNRLDDYAYKFLQKYCREALETPMPLPVDKIMNDLKLTVVEAPLSFNLDVFGCCMLLDGEVEVCDRETGEIETVRYPAGTVLIDPESEAMYGEGAKRNTLIHEAIHWEKDKAYFKIMAMKNTQVSEELYPILCRQSGTYYEPPEGKKTKENEVRWLEWQAHRLAPRVLMPANTFKKKALEFIENYQKPEYLFVPSCDTLIEDLSEFFIVSRLSVKYRLLEVGLEEMISKMDGYSDVYAEIIGGEELQKITPTEAYSMICNSKILRAWISEGHFIYADGYFVLDSPKYVCFKDGKLRLTAKAKRNLRNCVINIREQRFVNYAHADDDFDGMYCFYRVNPECKDVDKRIYAFNPKFQANFEKLNPEESYKAAHDYISGVNNEDEEIKLLGMMGTPTTSLCECLWFLMQNRHWTNSSIFAERTGLHASYYRKIKGNKYNNMGTEILMDICVALGLRLRIIEKLFDKSHNKLDPYQDPTRTYLRILESFPYVSLDDFNGILRSANIKELGTEEKK